MGSSARSSPDSLKKSRASLRSLHACTFEPKGAKERVVRMDSRTASLIQEHIFSRKEGRLVEISPSTIRTIIKRVAKKAGIKSAEKMTPHKLRHFFACDFLQRGGDIRSLQRLLGHSDLSTTEIYLSYSLDMVSQAYDKAFRNKCTRKNLEGTIHE